MATPATPAPDLSRLRIERAPARARRRSRALPWLLVLAALGAAAWFLRDRLGSVASIGRSPPAVSVATVRRTGPAFAEVTANGYVVARRQAALSTVLSGRLVEMNYEEGDVVEQGKVVARIQFDDYEAAHEAAGRATEVARARKVEAERSLAASRLETERLSRDNRALADLVAQAKATADRTARDVERNRALFEKKVIDAGTWDRFEADDRAARSALDAARSRLAAGEAALLAWDGEIARREAAVSTAGAEIRRAEQAEAEAAILVEKTYVRAPFTGLVVHKDAEVGEVVASTGFGTNTRGSVATIVDPETLEVQVELTEARSAAIVEGTPAEIHVDSAPERAWPGSVRQVWPTADRQKGTVEIRVVFAELPPGIKTELGVRVTFKPTAPTGSEPPRVLVARRAVVRRDGKDVVFVVQGPAARVRPVALGPSSGDEVEVKDGLAGGERVVLDPPETLADGTEVTTAGGSRP